MDFAFLYDEGRRLFYIGHDVTADRRDVHQLGAAQAVLLLFGDVDHHRRLARTRVCSATRITSWGFSA